MDRTRVAAILAATFGAASLAFAIARLAILDSSSGLVALALGCGFVAFIALATYVMLRGSVRRTAGLMVEYLKVSERASPADVIFPGWFWDGPDALTIFSSRETLPFRMVVQADTLGLTFLDESDEVMARVPWYAVHGISSSLASRGGPVPVPVITVMLPQDLLAIYPGAPRRRGAGFGWLTGSDLKSTVSGLESLRANTPFAA